VYQAGTLSANPVGMRAGLASLIKIEKSNGWNTLNARTAAFAAALTDGLSRAGAPVDVVCDASMFWLRLHADGPIRRIADIPERQGEWYRKFFHAALDRGVYLPPAAFEVNFLSMAHDDQTLAMALDVLVAAARS
jgi:glutamate-1-semialdehyde 2,1-aminomutase